MDEYGGGFDEEDVESVGIFLAFPFNRDISSRAFCCRARSYARDSSLGFTFVVSPEARLP